MPEACGQRRSHITRKARLQLWWTRDSHRFITTALPQTAGEFSLKIKGLENTARSLCGEGCEHLGLLSVLSLEPGWKGRCAGVPSQSTVMVGQEKDTLLGSLGRLGESVEDFIHLSTEVMKSQ